MTSIAWMGKRYIVYATREEARKCGERVMEIDDAEVGDYVPTRDGHYVPIIGKHYWNGSRGDKAIRDVLHYPGGEHYRFENNTSIQKGVTWDAKFWITREKPLETWKKHVAELTSRGMELYKAILVTFGGTTKYPVNQIAKNLMQDKMFIYYLFNETEGHMGLREELKSRGLDEAFLAEKIDDILHAPKVPANLTQWALQTIKEAYSDKKQMPVVTKNTQINNFNAPQLPEAQTGSVLDQLKRLPAEVKVIEEKKEP